MRRHLFLLGCLFLLPGLLFSQDFDARNYDWEKNPQRIQLKEEENKEPYIHLLDKRMAEYAFDGKGLVVYETMHKKIRVNDDGAIQQFNKVYIPLRGVLNIVDIKARSISKDGRIVEVNKNNIKELKDVEEYGNLKIFAIEGVEQGSDLEYLYTLKKEPVYYDREYFQNTGIIKNASMEIISPEELVIKTKSYNGFPVLQDTVIGEKRYLRAKVDHIPALNKEKYAAYTANLMRVEYKFSHNLNNGRAEQLTWADAAKRYYEYYNAPNPKADKQIAKQIKKLNIDGLNEEGKIKAIEKYIKNNFGLKQEGDNYADLEFILANKHANKEGLLILFMHFFNEAGVNYQLVMTSDRKQVRFDKDFMSWNYLSEMLFYFPAYKKFMAPAEFAYRYGMIPHDWAANDALFVKPTKIGELTTGIPSLGNIPMWPEVDKSYDNLDVNVTFNSDLKDTNVKIKRALAGHSAIFIHAFYDLVPEKEKENLINALLKFIGEDAQINSYNVPKYDKDEGPVNNPIIFEGDLSSKSLLEKAGKNYLFKIGMVIGPQEQMYQEKTRQCEVELDYPHSYRRKLVFNVPKGYNIKGLESLKINIEYGVGDKKTMGFVSDYVQEGDKITVNIYEYYSETYYPKAQFEEFRKVINAAADFNKVVLVFEKQ